MKILFLLSRIEKSGVALHSLDLIQGLAKAGHELVLLTGGITDKDNDYLMELYQQFKDLGVEIQIFNTPSGNPLKKALTAIFSIFHILRYIQKSQADIIHAQSPYMTFLPWLLRKKYITTVHNVQLKPNLMYKNPTHLIAISSASREYAIEKLGAKAETISVVCHGVSKRFSTPISEEARKNLKKRHNFGEEDYLIGFVGRIAREKGLDVLVEAVTEHLSPEHSEKMRLVFVGDYFRDSDRDWFEALQRGSGISSKIHRIPFSDPKPFYDIFDIFVLPSNSEAFGLVCVEAMLSGCCTVRTNTNGATDQITHEEEGFIFPVGDAKALAEILDWILVNPAKSGEIANKGKDKALDNFTIDSMTRKTLEVYQKIMP